MSGDPGEISKLGRACEDWGFFLAINHGASEDLMTRIQECNRTACTYGPWRAHLAHAKWDPWSTILHNGKWIQILTNGKYKSVVHKAVVNGSTPRMSLVVSYGPSLDAYVEPSERVLRHENSTAAYNGMTYSKYYDVVYKGPLPKGKSALEALKIMPGN
ncbi:hypothetical protein MLD38_018482 [Melastoma candidum]|uniref:Uncharacterized protein n=1 Tax=Melastoma candidum TaxID=119954 RepID=A0ACB9QX35_9MYRT|nr:hypothetical protein MLD38_018482 [Melastoma candidum]